MQTSYSFKKNEKLKEYVKYQLYLYREKDIYNKNLGTG